VEKGVGSLLRAVASAESLRLTVAGTGPEEPLLRELAGRIAPGRIDFAGHLDRAVLLEAVRASRAVVLPSEWYENAPLSALEAMASGVPVVAADLGGLPEIVRDGETGVTFPSGDVTALAAALTRLDASPEEARRLGVRGREVVEEEYSLDRQAETMLSIFREVMPSASR
jgi:glycosyltransferase involved in cell wall biosynthesis